MTTRSMTRAFFGTYLTGAVAIAGWTVIYDRLTRPTKGQN